MKINNLVSKGGFEQTPRIPSGFATEFYVISMFHWLKKARLPSGRASDSGARGRGFDPHSGCRVVSLSKIHLHGPLKSTGNTQEAVAPSRHD